MLLSFITRTGLMLMFQDKLKTLYFMDTTVSIFNFFFILGPLSEGIKFLGAVLDYPILVKYWSYS